MVDVHGTLFIFAEVVAMDGFWGEDDIVFKGVTRYRTTKLQWIFISNPTVPVKVGGVTKTKQKDTNMVKYRLERRID